MFWVLTGTTDLGGGRTLEEERAKWGLVSPNWEPHSTGGVRALTQDEKVFVG